MISGNKDDFKINRDNFKIRKGNFKINKNKFKINKDNFNQAIKKILKILSPCTARVAAARNTSANRATPMSKTPEEIVPRWTKRAAAGPAETPPGWTVKSQSLP